jgi:hypothetical protein
MYGRAEINCKNYQLGLAVSDTRFELRPPEYEAVALNTKLKLSVVLESHMR